MNETWVINNWKAVLLMYQLGYRYNIPLGTKIPSFIMHKINKRHPGWLTYCGATELTTEEFAKEHASHGKKVLYIKENLDK